MTTKVKRSTAYGISIFVLSSISTLIIILYMTKAENEWGKVFWILWVASLLPTAISGFVSAFLYHYLIDSTKRWVHVLCFLVNAALIVALAPLLAYVVLSAMIA